MYGLKYIIKIFWDNTDLAMCNCWAATSKTALNLYFTMFDRLVRLNTERFISIIVDSPDVHEKWRIMIGQTIQSDSIYNRSYDFL